MQVSKETLQFLQNVLTLLQNQKPAGAISIIFKVVETRKRKIKEH